MIKDLKGKNVKRIGGFLLINGKRIPIPKLTNEQKEKNKDIINKFSLKNGNR